MERQPAPAPLYEGTSSLIRKIFFVKPASGLNRVFGVSQAHRTRGKPLCGLCYAVASRQAGFRVCCRVADVRPAGGRGLACRESGMPTSGWRASLSDASPVVAAQAARLAAVRLCRWRNPHAVRGCPELGGSPQPCAGVGGRGKKVGGVPTQAWKLRPPLKDERSLPGKCPGHLRLCPRIKTR